MASRDPTPTPILRILDAAANRAAEAIRVIEDYVRFALDDRHLTQQCKHFRHDLTAALATLSADRLCASRETQNDVGTDVAAPQEYRRSDAKDVAAANFKRLEQSLRSLEEYAKTVSPPAAERLEPLRYRAYTLERAVHITAASRQRLADTRLHVLIDGGSSEEELSALAGPLVEVGVGMLQLRDKRLTDRQLLDRARLLRRLTQASDTLLIVNDRPDVAALARADGVQLGQEDMSIKDARTILGPDPLIGVSTHTIEQAQQAVLDGANYIGVGPVFASETKSFTEYPGCELLRAVAVEITLPAFAIGGITAANLPAVLSTGVTRIAVSAAVTGTADPAAAAKGLLSVLT